MAPSTTTMTSPAPAPTPEAARRWLLLAAATLQQAGLTFVRFGLPALAPFIRADLGLSLAQIGVVLGAFDLGALLTFYITGVATDRRGERAVMAAGSWATAALAAAAAFGHGVWTLAALLALAGVGFPSSQVAGSHAVMAWFPADERGVAMGVRQAGLPIGGFAAALILPWVAEAAGWRAALLVASAGCALAGLVTYVAMATEPRANDPRRAGEQQPGPAAGDESPGFWDAPRAFWRSGSIVWVTLMACLLAAAQFSLTGYLPLYLVDAFGWQRDAAARLLVVVHLGGIVGRLAWGWVSDHLFRGDRLRPLASVAVSGAMAAGLVGSLAWWRPLSPLVAGLAAFWSGFTLLGWNGLYVTLVSELAGRASATMLGLSMTVLYVSTMLSPPAFGHLVEMLGAYPVAWTSLIVVQLGAVAAVWAVSRARRGRELAGSAAGS